MSSFKDLPIHPVLLSAIAGRGYETATAVQVAVIDPALDGRDLLVSAPTGSGKTLAFGALLGADLLADRPGTPAAAAAGRAPRALIIVPTRELGVQVANELAWLFAGTRLDITPFTGGTAVAGDVKRLRSGVDIAVGTPGRLTDLHRRGSLALTAIELLVLDEADEMLDLGFREELEYLLGQAPATRRTLLFSATLPPEIRRLAATYQRDAARVDPRGDAGSRDPHADIQYVAHQVRSQDRLAAVVNVLLAARGSKAIVFCRTRQGVGELHQRLSDQGFAAVALSGDRAQGDRDRALETLREGRASVLVATNVAARGLDLPDVELVLHADLPDNADSLTHRSGRTGRAGKKGTSIVIATPAERRKAERLLLAVRAPLRWSSAPTAEQVRESLERQLFAELLAQAHKQPADLASNGAPKADGSSEIAGTLSERLRAALPERVLVALLVSRELERLPRGLPLTPVEPARRSPGSEPPHASPSHNRPFTHAAIFRVNLGTEAKAEPGWLLPLICRRGGVTRHEVGAIRVGPRSSTFEIAAQAAEDFALCSREPDPRAPHVLIEPVQKAAAPRTDRVRPPPHTRRPPPARPPRPPHPPKRAHAK